MMDAAKNQIRFTNLVGTNKARWAFTFDLCTVCNVYLYTVYVYTFASLYCKVML